ncbi:LOW QUALITY PROTEIN: hypothetical protein Cgig2_021368 [Carnegiea gigantea]|uniref:SAC domain-containing protein n=1 Tax=Carnegiea gigantea TaxID=171969 RepID=A0A9Q1KCJ9_9CARY|nr:LOW QUALITY PROTEIN: hypothetical protein Cgig2_021368 [Carnegiea gigantea]
MGPQGNEPQLLHPSLSPPQPYMQKFRLYQTQSKFYMIGRDKNRTYWRVLTIDRSEPYELDIREDSTTYTESECSELLRRIHEGNKSVGGLKFVTTCYGIVGFIKFLGPYYMLLITKRRQIGVICGHTIYAISKSEMIPLSNSTQSASIEDSRNENRYKKLLGMVDLTKDFFFSHSYHVMRTLQKNLCDRRTGQVVYETMFVWNEFLTRGIRSHLQNTAWTVALVYGFFKQATLSIAGRDFMLTLIARRSRHYAGTRYLKRGVNEKGRVANDVETEQIVFEDVPERSPVQISSVVQNRGSIPLFWSQETSRLNLKPDIILSRRDQNYEATRLHFENLANRYGNPIIILNLIKTNEKRPRESILRTEFANAIECINRDLPEENRLKFLHWDLHKHSRSCFCFVIAGIIIKIALISTYTSSVLWQLIFYSEAAGHIYMHMHLPKPELCGALICFLIFSLCSLSSKATNVLLLLGKVAAYALTLTGFFYCQLLPAQGPADPSVCPPSENLETNNYSPQENCKTDSEDAKIERRNGDTEANGDFAEKKPVFQKGVLRTNCIDCLDRTNVAQFAYGLAALGHQLHALDIIDVPKVDLDSSLADDLMGFYEKMGDTLAHQYGGSAAHNKIFSQRRGQCKAATQSQEFFRTLQRYYSNAYMDAEKQNAINVFLGHFQPQHGKPALWELGSDQLWNASRSGQTETDTNGRSLFKRCHSDGSILQKRGSTTATPDLRKENFTTLVFPDPPEAADRAALESSPGVSTSESDASYCRYTESIPHKQLFGDVQREQYAENDDVNIHEHADSSDCSNFVDLDWLSSSGNSCEEDSYERSVFANSLIVGLSSDNVMNGVMGETPSSSQYGSGMKGKDLLEAEPSYARASTSLLEEFSDSFVQWVTYGETLCH